MAGVPDIPWGEAARPGRGGTVLSVRVKPGASREGIDGVSDGRLVVRVTAPPVEDKANRAVVRLLAGSLGVPPSRLEIIKGGHARSKDILVRDWEPGKQHARHREDGKQERRGRRHGGGPPAARPSVTVGLIAAAAVMLHGAPAFTADFHPGSGGQQAPPEFTGQVTSVADGDTLEVSRNGGKEKVDLFGVDCPEKGQAYGDQAARFTSSLTYHRKVMIIPRGSGCGDVFLDDGRSLARELLQAGLAWWTGGRPTIGGWACWRPRPRSSGGDCGPTRIPCRRGSTAGE